MNLSSTFSSIAPSHLPTFTTLSSYSLLVLGVFIVIYIVIDLVLFAETGEASTNTALVTQQDREITGNPLGAIDLFFYRNAGRHVGMGVGIVCDRNDSTGASLLALSLGKDLTLYNHEGINGVKITGYNSLVKDPLTNQLDRVKFPVFSAVLLAHQGRGVVITSLGQPITTVPSYYPDVTNLLVR